jgi:hypothetical protein
MAGAGSRFRLAFPEMPMRSEFEDMSYANRFAPLGY